MVSALVFGPGEGTIDRARGSRMVFKARAADTDGAFSPHGARPSSGS
jgi:hypothetical protein